MPDEKSNGREQEHDDLLKALHGMGSSDESEVDGEETREEPEATGEEHAEGAPSPAASGFVGMLAKEGKGEGLDARATADAKAGEGEGGVPLPATTDQIFMAREIKPVASAAGGGGSGRVRTVRPAPGWYHAAVPVMYTLGVLLILIGFWAIGALLYMAVKTPSGPGDVWYPFLSVAWDPDLEPPLAGYTQGSRVMAWLMVACLPVSLALGMMAGIMQRHIRAGESRSQKPEARSQNSNS